MLINLLTTDDECHATLAACYQLAQCVWRYILC